MKNQKNWNQKKQLQIVPINANANPFEIYGRNVAVTKNDIRTRNIFQNFLKSFSMLVLIERYW